MKKAGRYAIRAIITIVLLFIVLWIAIWGYIRYNKSDLLSRITSRITEKTRAEARVDDLTASWFKTFPFISLELTGVQIKDSLWRVHNRTFLSAENVYLRLSPFGLFNKNRGIGKVIITNGNVRLFADSTFQNQYILRSDNPRSGKTMRLPDIELRNSELVLENPSRNKLHHFHLREFLIESDVKKDLQLLDVDADVMVKSLAFNTKKGSYVKNKNVVGDFSVTIDRLSKKNVV